MTNAYLECLKQDLDEAYSKWFWYYSDSTHDSNGIHLQEAEKDLIRLWSRYQATLKEEGKFPISLSEGVN